MKWVAALLGTIAGYYAVAVPSCRWIWPDSNLCGLWSPIGAAVGAGLAYWIARKWQRRGA